MAGIRDAVAHYWDVIEDQAPKTAGDPFQCAERAGEGEGVELGAVHSRSRLFRLHPELPHDGGQARFTTGRMRGLLVVRVLYDTAVPLTERRVIQAEDLHTIMAAFANPANYLAGVTDTINPLTTSPDYEDAGEAGEVVVCEFEHIYREG